jgi:hypothetical protein
MADLDEIMSGQGETAPRQDVQAQEPAQEPRQAQVQEPPEGGEGDDDADGLHKARDAERAKARKYKEELADVRQQLQTFQSQFTGFMQAFQAQQPRPAPQPEPPAPDFFEAPDAFVDQRLKTQLEQSVNPMREALMFNARLTANAIHTPERVSEAEQAFLTAVQGRQLDQRTYDAVVNSPNRFHAAVEWFDNRPENQRERLEAEILAKYGITPGQEPPAAHSSSQPSTAQPSTMPTSFAAARSAGPRTAPQWSGPKPLSELMPR